MSDCELLPACSNHQTGSNTTTPASEKMTELGSVHIDQDHSDADSFIEVSHDKGKARVQSLDETALAVWTWAQETFGNNAHLMFEELCERLQIPEHTSKKIRRRSMPAISEPNAALKRDEQADNGSVADTIQPRARFHSFAAETKPATNGTMLNDNPFTDKAAATMLPTTNMANNLNASPRNATLPSFDSTPPAYTLSKLMQYQEAPAVLTVPPRDPLRDTALPPRYSSDRTVAYPPLPHMFHAADMTASSSSHSMRWYPSGAPLRYEDTQLLLSALHRGLIPAEKLDPEQCQQLLAAQQHFARYPNRHPQASSPLRPEHLRRPLCAPEYPYKPGQPSPYRLRPSSPAQYRGPPHQGPLNHGPPNGGRPGQPGLMGDEFRPYFGPYGVQFNHTQRHHSNDRPLRRPSKDPVPSPLQSRPPLEQKGPSYDAARTEARRVQWVEDTQRAQRAEQTKTQDDVLRHAGLIEEHRASKKAHEERQTRQQAQREVAHQLMRSGSMQEFFRKSIADLQAKAKFPSKPNPPRADPE